LVTHDSDFYLKAYNFARIKVQLEKVILEEITTKKNCDEVNANYVVKMEFGTKTTVIDEETVDGYLRTVVNLKQEEKDSNDLEIVIVYRGSFVRKPESTITNLEQWVDMQVVPLLLSYVRTTVSNISVQMGFDPIVIPTMDVLESVKLNTEINQDLEDDLNVN
jgi:preprotein translocase subunit SecB